MSRGRRCDGEAQHEQRADHLRGLGDRERQDEQKDDPQQAHRHAARDGHFGVDRGEQQRAVEHGHGHRHPQGDHAQQQELAAAYPEDVAEEDVRRLGGKAVVEAQQQHAEPHAGRQDHADRRVALALAHAHRPDQPAHDHRTHEGAGDGVVGQQQARRGAREGELTGAVHGKGHAARDDERPDEPAGDGHQRRRQERMLGERQPEILREGHHPSQVSGGQTAGGW